MIIEWWHSLLSKWSWDDPMLLLGFASFVATAIIPIVLWRMGAKQAKRDSEQAKRDSELQAKILANLTSVSQLQRRDALLGIVPQASDPTYLALLWKEIREYEGGGLGFPPQSSPRQSCPCASGNVHRCESAR